MRFGWTVGVTAALLLLVLAPSAQAGLISKHEFEVGIQVVDFSSRNETQNVTDLGLTLMTGRLEARGERAGLYGFVNIRQANFANIDRIEVLNFTDQKGALQRAGRGECDSVSSCVVERTWERPAVDLAVNSTFIFFANGTVLNHTETAPFAIALLVQPPTDLAAGALGDEEAEQSALLMGPSLISAGRAPISTSELYGFLPNSASRLTISSNDESKTYTGGGVIFRFVGETSYDVAATGILTPFQGDAQIRLAPSPGKILRDEFDLSTINTVFSSLGSNETVIPEQVASDFKQIAPILNGVLFGGLARPLVDKQAREDTKLALLRFAQTDVRPLETGGAVATGRSDFLMFGSSGFYTTKSGTEIGFLRVPLLSWVLWALAAAAIVAGFVLKPIVAPSQIGAFGAVRLVGLLFHLCAFLLAFILWDFEIRSFLGTSLISIFADGEVGSGVIIGITAFFQLVPFFAAAVLFGLPVRYLVNSSLKLGGLKKARGIGKGIGDLAIWGLGAPFIPFLLNGVLQPALDFLQRALP